ncbi:protein YAE1 homolog [Ochotona curzoniae]|uniref:protein YAE1 homolog n=1 Tax=Ochotona curzoniae TaxID=130825 RepID=UPI001B353E1C|nr:protein YAE1 homolog [Ochotona curzoniae]
MSWVQAATCAQIPAEDGDVFDEEADESLLQQREWQNRMQRRVKEGYRDGVDAGKAVALQQGFSQGYKEGAGIIVNYGQLRGTLSALLSWCHRHDSGSAFISNFSRLLDAVGQCEECVLKHLKSVRQQPSVVDILDSMEDMDLCHVVPAERETNDAENEGLTHEDIVEGSKICSEHPSGMHSSDSKHSSTQEHACSEHPGFTWILEQTTSLVEQLGLSVDVLQHLKQL